MNDHEKFYSEIIQTIPVAVCYNKIITNEHGNPIDFQVLYINKAFEKFIGLNAEKIIGRKITEIFPEIINSNIDWVKCLGEVALSGKFFHLKNYSPTLKKWYDVKALSNKKDYFITVFNDISEINISDEKLTEIIKAYKYLNSTPSMILVLDLDGNISYFNEHSIRILECDSNDILGKNFFDTFWPQWDKKNIISNIKQLIENRVETEEEIKKIIITSKGNEKIILFHLFFMRDYESRIIGILLSGTEITKLEKIEETLRYRIEFEKLISSISKIFIYINPEEMDNRINFALQKIGEFTGVDRVYVFQFSESLTRMTNTHEWCDSGILPQIDNLKNLSTDVFPWWMDKLKRFETIQILNVSELPSESEKNILQAQDIKSLIVVPIVYNEVLKGFLGLDSVKSQKVWVDDIDTLLKLAGQILASALENKQTQEALRISEEKHRNIFENAAEGIYQSTLEGKFLSVNPAFTKMFGYDSPSEIILTIKDIASQIYVNPEVREKLLVRLRNNEIVTNFETECKRKNGEKFWIRINASAVKDKNGEIYCLEGTTQDITELKKAELDKENLQTQLLHSQKLEAIGILSAGIAHDFNNILTGVMGYASIIRNELDENNSLIDDINEIQKLSERASNLTQKLLLFSKRKPINLTVINLNEILIGILGMLKRVIGEDINIITKFDSNLSLINGDSSNIEQIILNLAVNARDAMPDGGELKIKTMNQILDENQLRAYKDIKSGNFVLMQVSDNGTGMDDNVLSHIFEPFFTTKGMAKGTGLGLSVVYGIVQHHGGFITVNSTKGKGTTFNIYLPARLNVETIVKKSEKDPIKIDNKINVSDRQKRIFIIEDEVLLIKINSKILRQNGYIIFSAKNAKEARYIFESEKGNFDLIICDVVLPDLNGVILIEELTQKRKDLKIIFVSGYSDEKYQRMIIDEKKYCFIQKPYNFKEFLKKINEIILSE